MSRKRHKPEEIVSKLRQVDVLVSQGQSVADAIRSIGVTEVVSGTSCSMESSSTACGRLRSSSRVGASTTTAHQNAHLSMSLKNRGFAEQDMIPRGIWGSDAPVR